MTALSGERGRVLLGLARAALEEASGAATREVPVEPAWLERPGACFVTLKIDGELCGCIGSLEAYRSLIEDLRANALAAAFRDPRFPPLEASQLQRLSIEVSVLSELEPVTFDDEADLLRRLRPGVDGLVLEHDGHRGTFLPSVWRQLPVPEAFLQHLKRKAGLDASFWSPDVRISRYTVDSWTEPPA